MADEKICKNKQQYNSDDGDDDGNEDTGSDCGLSLEKLNIGSRKKLVIFSLNGFIVHRVSIHNQTKIPSNRTPDGTYGSYLVESNDRNGRNAEGENENPRGELGKYLDGLADAKDVQIYVKGSPFGMSAISSTHPDWKFYSNVLRRLGKRNFRRGCFPGQRAHSSPGGWHRLRAAVGLLLSYRALSGKSYQLRLIVLQFCQRSESLEGEREIQKVNRYYNKFEQGSRAITKSGQSTPLGPWVGFGRALIFCLQASFWASFILEPKVKF
ncbi:unnamed protein product [Malus baccata var. baccata]